MHLFIGFEPFILNAKIFSLSYSFKHRSIELDDVRISILVIAEKGVFDMNLFGRHFNSRDFLCGKETYTVALDPEETRVTRPVVDRYGDQWEITSGVRITTRKRFTTPVCLPVWIARSLTHPDMKPFGFNLSSDPERALSTMSSIRHEPL